MGEIEILEKTGASLTAYDFRTHPRMPSVLNAFLEFIPLNSFSDHASDSDSECAYLPSRVTIHAAWGSSGSGISLKMSIK